MYRIYTLVLRAGLTVLSPYFLLQSRRYWPTLADRFGRLKLPQLNHTIWIHAVSVGEVKAVEKLIERIRKEFPDRPVVLSTTTVTGQQLAREKLANMIDHTLYFPVDLPGPVNRTLDRLRPDLVIIAETEIWPNFLRLCRRRGVPVMMINGRISDKSLSGYRSLRRWLGKVLDDYTVLGMQSEMDRRRIESMGANTSRVTVFGNLKYDVISSNGVLEPKFAGYLGKLNELWIAASTMPGEDEPVLDAFRKLKQSRPSLKLMIAPRHPERCDAVEEAIRARGLSYSRRSALEGDADVVLLDTIGELAAAFEFASVVFMGGSLVSRGGHNVLEPARHSKPVIFGPHMENFRDIARLFLEANAAIQIPSASELAPAVERVLSDGSLAASLGRNANQVVRENTGATDRVISFIRERVFAGN
jgi:3-deoxy-D-manno-octulosonic-acid transferase